VLVLHVTIMYEGLVYLWAEGSSGKLAHV
jgi:hypothetical protein